MVLGGGATAASVLLALAELGCTTASVLVRDPAVPRRRSRWSARTRTHRSCRSTRSRAPAASRPTSLVSTIPAEAQTPDLVARAPTSPAVFEVVYDPWPTPLARAALDDGRHLVAGLDLLAHQAVGQVQRMTGRAVSVDLLREAGRRELERAGLCRSTPERRPVP